ncbi:MAG: glutamate--tRNA ligase [SAR202 cluster bacterium]|nr:glutamate--tRNA ligase [SAR202 cluster bacterium]
MTRRVRVRFAPSPTGEPHVGNIRTAVFEWLFARRHGGDFIVRIEDTDQARKVEGAVESILDSLRWLGLDWDEGPDKNGPYGPYYQSQRLPLYKEVAGTLIASGRAYECYCSSERLKEMRDEQAKRGQPPGYDQRCRTLSDVERERARASGTVPVVRFAMPTEDSTTVRDLIRGDVSFENRLLDDFVILKSDGFPTYHLAHMVDDHHMEISHVIRAEEWLPSLPRHWQIYEALGWEKPHFAHVPIILAPDRSKLSKRHGATSVREYQEMGYLPQAMVNFLALLGWSLDDKTEVMSAQQMIDNFSIDRISKSPAIFNIEKLDWMNGHYIRGSSNEALAEALLAFWKKYPPDGFSALPGKAMLVRIVPLIKERLKKLNEAAGLIRFFFADVPYEPGDLVQKGMDTEAAHRALGASLSALTGVQAFDAATLEGALRPLADQLGLKAGQLFGTLRVAVTGLKVSPPLFETMELLGREKTVASVKKAIARLTTP